jgi:hypothetical protein
MARNSALRSYLPSSQQAKRGGGILAAGALALAGAAIIVDRPPLNAPIHLSDLLSPQRA